jgi:hypothetical protein
MHSLYGDGRYAGVSYIKPEAMAFLKNVRWLVMDEVDRLLGVKSLVVKEGQKSARKPAAVVAAAVPVNRWVAQGCGGEVPPWKKTTEARLARVLGYLLRLPSGSPRRRC